MLPLLLSLFLLQEDPGPPVIKRGPNAPRKKTEAKPSTPLPLPPSATPTEPESPAEDKKASSPQTIPDSTLLFPNRPPLLVRAWEVAEEFNAALPAFVCDEIVDRFESNSKPEKWKKKDRVEVDVMYVNGKEDYANPRINGKPFKGADITDTGTWSRGDWGATLMEVLSPASQAEFTRRPPGKDKDVIAGIETEIYDLRVKKANSAWTVQFGSILKPEYTGSIWVDPITARVLRIEKKARRLPATYELDSIETVLEYGWVTISGQKYLMPAQSSSLACKSFTTKCMRNDMVFQNYRRFTAESSISTTESEIKFDDPPPAPAAKPPAKKKP